MTRKEILALEAGRDLDQLIAKEILGKKPCIFHEVPFHVLMTAWQCEHANCQDCYPTNPEAVDHPQSVLSYYSSRINDAWMVVEAMADHSTGFSLGDWPPDALTEGRWVAEFGSSNYAPREGPIEASADTAPLAICRAALIYLVTYPPG